VGLNLTAADTVIHFDPWWNPAVEAQATDRAHRIGQRRIVTSIKLIARDTVEERVLRMQEKKRELLAGAVDADAALERLSAEDLRELTA
jgi:SNF2 family DNA or RNA helicase